MSIDNNIDFKDHIVQYPNRFKQTTVAPGIVELVPTWIETPEQIIQSGTPVDSELFKKLKENVTCYSQTYTATEGQTVFPVTHPYNVGQSRISVYVGGIKQRTILDFTEASSTSFILNVGLPAGTKVEAVTISFVQPLSSDVQQQIDSILTQYGFNTIRINETNIELSKKADKTYVDSIATNLASGSPKGTYSTLAALQSAKPNGDSSIYLVTADGKWYFWSGTAWTAGGTYQSTGIADAGVTRSKIALKNIGVNQVDFVQTGGKNLFNKETATFGFQLATWGNNQPFANSNYYISDYIKVKPSTRYRKKQSYGVVFYDATLSILSSVVSNDFTTPASCAYIRIEVYITTLDGEQVEEGDVSTTYEAYKLSIPRLYIETEATEGYDKYPFQPTATLKTNGGTNAKTILKNAIKRIEVYGGDSRKKYALGIVQRNYQTYGTGMYLAECGSDGSFIKYVAVTTIVGYSEPTSLDVFQLSESGASGVTAKIWVDWSQIPTNSQYVQNTYANGGLDQRVFVTPDKDEVSIKLPPSVFGLVGKEVNLYFDNVILTDNPNNYHIDVTCNIGVQQNERWTCVPTTAGSYPLTVALYKNGTVVASASTNVVVKASGVGNGVTKKAIFIGDSTTDAGAYTGELLTLFGPDPMNLTLLGTRGSSDNRHEGRAGWKASNYVGNASLSGVVNAFWNPSTSAFDFTYYMSQQGYTDVDTVNIHLGINDVFNLTSDATLLSEITNVLTRFDTMITSIKSFNASIKIGLMITIPPSKTQDAFGKNYASGQTRWRYKRNILMFANAMIEKYKNREGENLYLIPININLDTENNMETESVAVNSRNSKLIARQSNGVHPATSGYYQMADMVYYWLKSFET